VGIAVAFFIDSGLGISVGAETAEHVLYNRLIKGHDVFEGNENLYAEILATQGSYSANRGAEDVWHDYFKAKGHSLLNDPKTPPLSSMPGKLKRSRERVGEYFRDLERIGLHPVWMTPA
jgi:hypothetical protein